MTRERAQVSKAAVVEVQVKAAIPTNGGCAVFLGNDEKVFVIYIDQMVGAAIMMYMRDISKERPQTHDLMADILLALGAKIQRVIINHFDAGVYYARLIIACENELQEKKIIEILLLYGNEQVDFVDFTSEIDDTSG